MTQNTSRIYSHIAVIGGGIVGACTALELTRRGHRVTLIEPAMPGGTQAASYGNGAFISPASVIPMSVPGLWRKVPGYLLDRRGPLAISPASLPRLLPWLTRFLLAGCTPARLRRTATAIHALIHDAPRRHKALAESIGHPGLIAQNGLLYVYPDRAAFEAESSSWALRRDLGISWQELGRAELAALEPGLSESYRFAAFLPQGAQCTDPASYTRAIIAKAESLGLQRLNQTATGFQTDNGRLTGVKHDAGLLACDAAVITAGIRSSRLAGQAGEYVPLEAERGYHIEIDAPNLTISRPVMPSDGKMANTMVAGRLRAAGQVELSSADAPPNWYRADILLAHLRRAYPGLEVTENAVRRWQGNRPSTPDGLPVIGPSSRCAGLFHAFGHGHIGLNAAPATAEMIADLVGGASCATDPAPYTPKRFRP